MKKKNMLSLFLVVVIILIVVLIILFAGRPTKDIEVNVLDMSYENNKYFVNISLKNNQDKTGWISDTYLETVDGSVIDLTGAGIDEKVESGETNYLRLFSTDVTESITDPPFKLSYTVFPSGRAYSVEI
jgi:hypothetical protein